MFKKGRVKNVTDEMQKYTFPPQPTPRGGNFLRQVWGVPPFKKGLELGRQKKYRERAVGWV